MTLHHPSSWFHLSCWDGESILKRHNEWGGNILQNENTTKTEPCRRGTRETWCKFQVSTNSCFANRATNTGSIVTKARTVNATVAFCALHAVLQIIRSTCTTKPAGRGGSETFMLQGKGAYWTYTVPEVQPSGWKQDHWMSPGAWRTYISSPAWMSEVAWSLTVPSWRHCVYSANDSNPLFGVICGGMCSTNLTQKHRCTYNSNHVPRDCAQKGLVCTHCALNILE